MQSMSSNKATAENNSTYMFHGQEWSYLICEKIFWTDEHIWKEMNMVVGFVLPCLSTILN